MNNDLYKKASHAAKGFDKVAAEIDTLSEQAAGLEQQILQCNSEELGMISGFDEMVVYYNDVAASRYKHIKKQAKQLREARNKALEELVKLRTRLAELETRSEIMSYRQGELLLDTKLEAVRKRKWQPAAT
jgi:predicted nuclease with TOPRIM domain